MLKKLADIGPFVDGSMAKVKRKCGNKNCKCVVLGEKHKGYYLMYKVSRVTKAVYIPADLEGEAREYIEYKKLKKIIAEISKVNKSIIARYVTEKKQKRQRK